MDTQYSKYNKKKHFVQAVMFTIFRLFSYSIAVILFCILGFILVKGFHTISWEFITEAPADGMTKGGIWPAIVGTCCLMLGSAIFAFPVGVVSGIYMNEYAPKGKLVNFIRMMTNNLAGIPSIVFGLFGMAFFVNYMGFGDSIIAGSLTYICDERLDSCNDALRSMSENKCFPYCRLSRFILVCNVVCGEKTSSPCPFADREAEMANKESFGKNGCISQWSMRISEE